MWTIGNFKSLCLCAMFNPPQMNVPNGILIRNQRNYLVGNRCTRDCRDVWHETISKCWHREKCLWHIRLSLKQTSVSGPETNDSGTFFLWGLVGHLARTMRWRLNFVGSMLRGEESAHNDKKGVIHCPRFKLLPYTLLPLQSSQLLLGVTSF